MTDIKLSARYGNELHRLQSALKFLILHDKPGDQSMASPKHLRVGLDARAADMKGLVDLLIAKGVITKEEYLEAIVQSITEEADRATAEAQDIAGFPITFG